MTRQDVENVINLNVKDNTTRDVTPAKMREALMKILDWIDASGVATGVETLDVSDNVKYTILAGKKLISVVPIPTEDLAAFGAGTASGVNDILPGIPVAAGSADDFTLNLYAKEDRDVWFNGITAATTLKLFLQ